MEDGTLRVKADMGFEVLPGTGGMRLEQPTGEPFEIEPPAINTITD